jgi:Wings apart-like protein regulation of heterochromatin
MLAQDGKPRRKPLVYGRAKRATPACNPFEDDDAPVRILKSRSGSLQDEIQLEQQQIHGQLVKSVETPTTGKLSNIRQHALSTKKLASSEPSAQTKPAFKGASVPATSAFDFPQSDDEHDTILFQKSMQKRRRLTPIRNYGYTATAQQRELSWPNTNEDSNEDTRRAPDPATTKQAKVKSKSAPRPAKKSSRGLRTPSPEKNGYAAKESLYTPKQSRLLSHLLDSAGPTDSPSKLPLTFLSLTSTERSTPELLDPIPKPSSQAGRVQGGLIQTKRRLIDAMISPRKRMSVSASSESDSENSALGAAGSLSEAGDDRKEVQAIATTQTDEINGAKPPRAIPASSSLSSLAAVPKPRTTYSRERSHLADMVSEDLLEPISQAASQEDNLLMCQNGSIFSSFHSVISQDPEEGDVEEEIGGIRSIHELRHAGSTARSRVDVESLLEDIEAKGPPARARRIRGLTQLTEKLGYPDIAPYILEQSIDQRLLQCPYLDGDVVGQTLLMMVLCRLMISVQLPTSSLTAVLETLLPFAKALLHEPRTLNSMLRDRKQNLSKVTSRDVAELIEPFCSSPVWLSRQPKSLSPQLVCLRSLDIVLRQARQLGDFDMVLPASIFRQLVELLLRTNSTLDIDGKQNDGALIIELTISVIESLTISRRWADDGCLEIAKELPGLGPLLNRMALSSSGSPDQTHLLVLRLILNITNNEPDLCDAFTEPVLLSAIFGIVLRDFIQTPILANGALVESKLEGVILALGALSNLAEHSSVFRQRMLDNSVEGRSLVDWIAFAFRDQVEAASEVSSLVLFAFYCVLTSPRLLLSNKRLLL